MSLPKKDQQNDSTFLQEEYKPVFVKYFEGYSCREISDALHIPIQTVRERLRKSKRKLNINFKLFARSFRSAIKKQGRE